MDLLSENECHSKTEGSSNAVKYSSSNITVIDSRACNFLLMKLRDKETKGMEFSILADRLMRILAEEALCRLPSVQKGTVTTPCGIAEGLVEHFNMDICAVSIVRSGDILQEAFRQIQPGVKVGKILIQRDETTPEKNPVLFYKKLPKDINNCFVILMDPMLATAGSAKKAISVLQDHGVKLSNIMFLNLICAPEGIEALIQEYPEIQVLTGAIDSHLNKDRFIVPGLGDYGDRYYGTQ